MKSQVSILEEYRKKGLVFVHSFCEPTPGLSLTL